MGRPSPKTRTKRAGPGERGKRAGGRALAHDVVERERTQQALRESEERFRATFEQAAVGVAHTTTEGGFLQVNSRLCQVLGYSAGELLGLTTRDLTHPDDRDRQDALRLELLSGRRLSFAAEKRYVRKDGSAIWVNRTVTLARRPSTGVRYLIQVIEDISERKRTEARLARLTRARRVMAECNHVLIHAEDEARMLESMCSIVVDSGGYKLAWVGYPTGEERRAIHAVAHAGFGSDVPMSAPVAWSADGRYQGFMWEVIATGKPHIARDILNDPRHDRRRLRARQLDFQSSIALPLESGGAILGAIAIYAREADAFDKEEIALLTELAIDISYGIVHLRTHIAREEAEERSRETERRFRETFEQAAVGLTRVDLNGVLVDFNQKFCDMLGYSRKELLGTTIKEITHPDDYGQGSRFRAQLVDGIARSRAGEKRFMRKDGSVMWARRTMSTACDAAGRPQYVISVVEDITERKETDELYRATFDGAPVGIMHVDLKRIITQVNSKACEILGYTREELIDRQMDDLIHPDFLNTDRHRYTADMLGGRRQSYASERLYLRKDGSPIWVNRTISLVRGPAGQPLYYVRTIEDISERKAAEERYRATFDSAPVGIMHTGIEDDRILHVNPRLCEMLGYSHDELLGLATDDLLPAELRGTDRGNYRGKMLSGELKTYASERKFVRKDGSSLWVNRTVSLARDSTGRPLYFIRIVEDITERKKAEQQFHDTFDQAAVGIAHVGFDEGYIRVNRKFSEITGYPEPELIGSPSSMVSHAGDVGSGDKARKQLLAGEIDSYANEKRYRRKDGATIWVNRTESLARDETGKALYYIRVIEDITRRKTVEDERTRLSMIVENANDAIIGRTLDGTITSWNAAAERMFGYSQSEMVGQSISILVPEQHRHLADNNERLRRGEVIPTNERIRVTKDGRILQVQSGISPIKNDAGKVIGAAVIVRDITERKRLESRFRDTFEQAAVGIFHADLNGRYLRVNRKFCEITGYTEEELTGPSRPNLSYPDDLDSGGPDRKRLLSGEITSHSNEKRYVRKDGAVIWVNRTESLARDEAGNPQYLIRVVQDVTERVLSTHRRAMEHAVTQALAESTTVEGAMRLVLQTICQALEWTCGAYWKWDERDELLRCAETWHVNAPGVSEFVAASVEFPNEAPAWHGTAPGTNAGGIVRRVWFSGAAVWFPDVVSQPDFRRGTIATKADLRSAFGFPILSGTRPLGVMEFYSREIRQPDDALLQIVRAIGSQIGQFIQREEAEQALRRSEERYRDVFEASPLPMWVWDDETLDILAVNQAAIEHYGYSNDEFLRMNVRDIWLPDEAPRYENNIRNRAQEQALNLQRRHRTKDGRIIDTEVTARQFMLGARVVWLTLANDVTVRMHAEAALRESEEQFRQLSGNIPQVFWITDTSHRETLYVSPAAEAMLGRPLQDILSDRRALVRAVHKEDRARVYAARRAAVESGYDETYRILRPDGSIRWVHDRAFPVRDGEGRIYRIAGIAEDVTDRKQAEERLEHLAHYDVLTNLPNRALFYDRIKQALLQARRNRWTAGVMFIDADRFKNVNDTLGHAVGDKLLQQIAGRLTRSVRAGDTVGRVGGDEFAIVLSTLASAQDATLVAQKIMAAFNEPFKLEGTEVYVTVSIGITLYPDDSSDQDTLIKNADAAMYRVKEIGRNGYQFYMPEMNARAIELLGMESSLRRALERNEFLLHYQPKASIADGDITGLEALLRWRHPERGIVPPGEFIPLLEESGLIVQVGEWVLKAVCSQVKAWERAGDRPVPVAVNLSARQFTANDLGPTIKRILEEHQVDPALIELEITESSLMANTEEAVRTLEYLDQLGVGLSIDDFGTGYSSLGYLKRFPISALKIDRSFVRDVTSDGDDATITRAVISMAHSLGLKVIAEGVETQAQFEFLAEYGCNEIQGYYFSRPLAAEACSDLIRSEHRLERPEPASELSVPVVLLLDDDEGTLTYFKRILSRDGYQILTACNAREGLALLRDHRVDVAVSDQNMPGMSGVDFLQCVQTLSPHTMRILATGFADFQTMTDAVNKGGIFRCLPKDISDDALRACVREAVQAKVRALENSIPAGTLGKLAEQVARDD